MRAEERVPIGTRVFNRAYGEGTIIGVYHRNHMSHLIQFDRRSERLGLHDGCDNAIDASGKKVIGKGGHCFFMRSYDFTYVDDFEGNL